MEMLFQKNKQKKHTRESPGRPVVKLQALTAESLVRELSSHKPQRITRKTTHTPAQQALKLWKWIAPGVKPCKLLFLKINSIILDVHKVVG